MLTYFPREFLLDSNSIIYLLQSEPKSTAFIEQIAYQELYISTISRTEVLLGSEKEAQSDEDIIEYLELFHSLPLTTQIADHAATLYKHSKKKLKFKDLIIASTAIIEKKTLLTSDKDFLNIPNLQIHLL